VVQSGIDCDGAVPLLLSCHTIEKEAHFLHHADEYLDFGKVWIGRSSALNRTMILSNPSLRNVEYEIDFANIKQVFNQHNLLLENFEIDDHTKSA
jgi:hypothetical protein